MGRGDRPAGRLWASYDTKVSPRQGWQGPWRTRPGRHLPRIGNSFGLPAGVTCPGATRFCEGCYGKVSERRPRTASALEHNLALLTAAGSTEAMAALIADMLDGYETEARNLDPAERIFRIHWDGDFFSADYARAWAAAIGDHAETRFWCYTRSFRPPLDVLPVLMPVRNLRVYLSVDADNRTHAAAQLARWPGLRAAYCADDYAHARELAGPRQARELTRPIPCPENARRIPIADNGQGACVTCAICPQGRRDIMFATSHREDTGVPVRLIIPRASDNRREQTLTCKLPSCQASFTRTPGTRGRTPDYCSRQCQVRGYTAERKTGRGSL